MIDDILFAYDLSPSSERALSYGANLAERTGAMLHFIHVQETSKSPLQSGKRSPAPNYKIQDRLKERCRASLDAVGTGIADDRLSFEVAQSEAVAPALLRSADRREADLIVMGTHGRRGVRRAIYGSVAEEILRTASCPVLIVRAEDDDAPASSTVENLVVPIDFSDPSRAALQYAGRLAAVYDVPMQLVHVVESPKIPSVYNLESPKLSTRKVKVRAEEALDEWGQDLPNEGRNVSYVVHRGAPAESILSVADRPEDLIVMATRGLSGVRRAMLGSVTEEIVRDAQGPVVAARTFPGGVEN